MTTSYIDTYGGESTNYLHWQFRAIRGRLTVGPVVIAERHDKPAARAVIADLIQQNAVNRLFLEVPDIDLRHYSSREILHCLRHNDEHSSWGNPIGLNVLWSLGREKGTIIIGCDQATSDAALSAGTKPQGMLERNTVMGQVIKQRYGDSPGTVILVGARHLYPQYAAGGTWGGTVPGAAGIGPDSIVDLSAGWVRRHK